MGAMLLLLVGCNTMPPATVPSAGDPPVRYVQYIKVANYDSSTHPATSKLTIFREVPNLKYHTIATLTVSGTADKEGALVNALAWKARQLGADSIIILTPSHPHRDEWIFRADAILTDLAP